MDKLKKYYLDDTQQWITHFQNASVPPLNEKLRLFMF